MAKYLIKNKFPEYLDSLDWIEPPIEKTNLYLVISKKVNDARAKIEAFNLGLKQIKEDGTYDKIIKKRGF